MIDNYKKAWRQATDMKGRASRSEYWYFILANILIALGLGFFEGFFGTLLGILDPQSVDGSLLANLYMFATLIPSATVAIRRGHDSGKALGFMFIPFYNIYLAIKKGTAGPNQYGPDPLAIPE